MIEERFWGIDITWDDHAQGIISSINNDELVGIVDEKTGGIIAYAIGDKHAEMILDELRKSKQLKEEYKKFIVAEGL